MALSRQARFYLIAFACWLISCWLALHFGAVDAIPTDIWMQVRLPRVVLASAIGIGLAVAGAALQALFTNPLCEPYTLGISSGSALGAVIGLSLGLDWNFAGLTGPAFLGALAFAAGLFLVSIRLRSSNATLLLSGVMLGFLGSSLVALWIATTDTNGMQSSIGWLFGDLSRARLQGAWVALISVLVLSLVIWSRSRELDGFLMGEEGASSIGIDVPGARRSIVLLTSLLVGVCVSAGGMIGFVGLVVPHLVRRKVGSMHFHLVPLAGIWGACLLVLADCGARFFIRPYELPVGILTALVGAPVFLFITLRRTAHG